MRVTADKVTEPRLFITSDLHLGHKAIIQYCKRPFDFTDKGIEECDDFLLEQYRNTVNENDMVIFLGDLTFKKNHKGQKMTEIITKLPGRKVLIKGNHDWYKDSFYRKCGFSDRAPKIGLVERFNFGLLPRFNLSLVARFNFGLPNII